MGKDTFSLKGKNVLVTGGSRGIGISLALGFADAGAENIAICSRKEDTLLDAKGKIEERGAKVIAVPAHLGKLEDIDGLFEKIKGEMGTLDILVNNVGMNIFTPAVTDADESLWDKIIDTNLKSVFLVSQRGARMMKDAGKGGKIINISTVAARRATPGLGIYGVAKAGVEMLTKVLAQELAPFNIQVNAIALAMIKTKFSEPLWSNPDILKQIAATNPMGRIGDPEEVVGAALFLASEASSFVTGSVILLDGGTTA
ncbi:MAG: glucose 1-dehydrogenase [Deltaproteobacteria bacterium]|uniref:Glucose 1-dehydrogenase n=1 Tax=Candidatus Zymogenus saltonus TaxID=2844893 RepID=A0A9D8KD89_9DELT|nr:glucose 1-dehydrogenase [Candidatus Zymogenus saltonus]